MKFFGVPWGKLKQKTLLPRYVYPCFSRKGVNPTLSTLSTDLSTKNPKSMLTIADLSTRKTMYFLLIFIHSGAAKISGKNYPSLSEKKILPRKDKKQTTCACFSPIPLVLCLRVTKSESKGRRKALICISTFN